MTTADDERELIREEADENLLSKLIQFIRWFIGF